MYFLAASIAVKNAKFLNQNPAICEFLPGITFLSLLYLFFAKISVQFELNAGQFNSTANQRLRKSIARAYLTSPGLVVTVMQSIVDRGAGPPTSRYFLLPARIEDIPVVCYHSLVTSNIGVR
jgi:hypothetical protein